MSSQMPGYINPGPPTVGQIVTSGSIASGAFSSGALVPFSRALLTDTFLTAEIISGATIACAVAATKVSGNATFVQTAMASVSGRMPGIGIVTSNYLSGTTAVIFRGGSLQDPSLNFSGWLSSPVYVGRSGQLVASGAPASSGDIQQIVGEATSVSGMMIQLGDPFQGVAAQSGDVASGAITGQAGGGYFCVASGTLTTNDLGSGAIVSGLIASGQLGRFHFASGTVIDLFPCGQSVSGVIAVAWGSGGCFVVPAERQSGLRLPAVGVAIAAAVSGALIQVVRRGLVTTAVSGVIASGFYGQLLYVGSGGLILNQSGFHAGASSGGGPNPSVATISGCLVQRIGTSVSGGIDVCPDTNVTSGLLSGLLAAY